MLLFKNNKNITKFEMADAIGIDCGSYKTVLGCVKQRGIEIVLSDSSGKTSPTIAAFTAEERLIGDAAVN